jgi:hypothetical protein
MRLVQIGEKAAPLEIIPKISKYSIKATISFLAKAFSWIISTTTGRTALKI